MRSLTLLLPIIAFIHVASYTVNRSYDAAQEHTILPETEQIYNSMRNRIQSDKGQPSSYEGPKIRPLRIVDTSNGI